MFGVVVILLLNVMEVFSVGGGALLDRPCMVFQIMCMFCLRSQCAYKCSFHRFCLCFCMSEVISSFKSLRAGSNVVSLCDFDTIWSSMSLHLLCIFTNVVYYYYVVHMYIHYCIQLSSSNRHTNGITCSCCWGHSTRENTQICKSKGALRSKTQIWSWIPHNGLLNL